MHCVENIDCDPYITNRLCYTNASWYYPSGEIDEDIIQGCLCNTWYAWTGEDCIEYSTQTFIIVTLQFILGIFATILIYSIITGFRQIDKADDLSKIKISKTVLALLLCSTVSVAMNIATHLLNVLLTEGTPPEYFQLVNENNAGGRGEFFSGFVFPTMSICFTILGSLHLLFLWIEIVQKLQIFDIAFKKFEQWRVCIIVFETLLVTICVASIAFQAVANYYTLPVLLLPFMFILCMAYFVVAYATPQNMKYCPKCFLQTVEATSWTSSYVLCTIAKTGFVAGISFLCIAITQLLYLVSIDEWKESEPPGGFSLAKLYHYLLPALLLLLTSVQKSFVVRVVSKTPVSANETIEQNRVRKESLAFDQLTRCSSTSTLPSELAAT